MSPNNLKKLADFGDPPPLTHLKRLTTKDGIIQHADLEVPDPSYGYSIDDNARALIVCLWHYQLFGDQAVLQLATIYFNYIKKVEVESGSFHNFLSFTEKVLDAEGSEDSIGRAIWALGETVALHPDQTVKDEAAAILARTNVKKHAEHAHLRAKAYILLGLAASNDVEGIKTWANLLVEAYQKESSPEWQWFEGLLCYANGTIPYALAVAYKRTQNPKYLEVAELSYNWLDKISRIEGVPAPIGQAGWYYRDRDKALYDQQPLEAADMVMAATRLYRVTGQNHYLETALEWISWYFGNNCQKAFVYNEQTRGVFDAVTPGGVNLNQGAEAIITFILAYLSLAKLNNEH